jgi:hypothetical protein
MNLVLGSARKDPAVAQIRSELHMLRRDLRRRRDITAALRSSVVDGGSPADALAPIERARGRLQRSRRRILALSPRTGDGKRARRLTAAAIDHLDQALAHLAASCRTGAREKVIAEGKAVLRHARAADRSGRVAARILGEAWGL